MNLLDRYTKLLNGIDLESIKLSLQDVHVKGLFSLVISGKEAGKLTRVFIADKKIKPFDAQYHTHRYPITLTVLKGDVRHHVATIHEESNIKISEFEYSSFLNGGGGLKYKGDVHIENDEYTIPIGSSIDMSIDEIHTVSCSKGAIWVVQEHGFKTQKSLVYGLPFCTDGLYREPSLFQINDKLQRVIRLLKSIILDYKLCDKKEKNNESK